MSRFAVTFAVTFFGVVQQAHAFCEPGTVQTCFVNGVEGTQTCDDTAHFGPCIVPGQDPLPAGQCFPKYRILTVIYAPPGRTGGSASSVSYGSQSSLGTTSSSTNGFKSSYAVQGQFSTSFLFKGSATVSFGYARNTVDSTSTDIKKSTSTTITDPGPATNGIDHDQDEIWLWLGPTIDVNMPNTSTVQWGFNNAAIMNIQFVYVGHLKNPSLMPAGVKSQLDAYGITTTDYAEMLKADPFANDRFALGTVPIDGNRYAALNMTFPYEPPFASGEPSTTTSFNASYTATTTSSTTVTNEYRVGMTISVGANLPVFHSSLKTDNSWTWTDTNLRSNSTGSTESATLNITGPSYGYAGSTDMAVYYDLIYKTFLVAPYTPTFSPAVSGVLISDSSAPVAGKEVVLVADGVTYTSFTNQLGEFRIYGPPTSKSMQLRVGKTAMSVGRSAAPIVISVP